MKREIGDYIEDILEAMTNAIEFTKDMSYEEFVKDIPWRSMAGMRDKVIHAYFGVKIERVWEVVKRDIPNLKPKFEKMLREEVKD